MVRGLWIGGLITLVTALLVAGEAVRRHREEPPGPMETIAVGVGPGDASLLVALAEGQGFFRACGLEVVVKEYETGSASLSHLLQGDVEIATASEFPFVSKSLSHPDLRILASIATLDSNEIVGRRDHGIEEPADLRGKRIGVTPNTMGEFSLRTYLIFHHIWPEEVTVIERSPSRLVEGLMTGELDAALSWDIYVYEMKKRLGSNAVSWPAQSNQDYYWLLITKQGSIERRPDTIERFLGAVVRAERFARSHEEEARMFLVKRWHRDPEYVDYVWQRLDFSVLLPQGLIVAMEDIAKEIIEDAPEPRGTIPNYLDYIHQDDLRAVKPKGITIFQ